MWGENKKVQQVGLVVMPRAVPPPAMSTWAPMLRNRLFDPDQQQSNIPYFGDEVRGQSSKQVDYKSIDSF